jgi:hypothetical protein
MKAKIIIKGLFNAISAYCVGMTVFISVLILFALSSKILDLEVHWSWLLILVIASLKIIFLAISKKQEVRD